MIWRGEQVGFTRNPLTNKTDLALGNTSYPLRRAASGGIVLVDWDACTVNTPTAGWTVEKTTEKTFGGKMTLKITATAGAATGGSCTITTPSTFYGGLKRKGFHVCPSDAAIEAHTVSAVQIWPYYTTGSYDNNRMQAWAYANHGVGDWAQGYVYDQDTTAMQHLAMTPGWANLEAENSALINLVLTKAAGVAIGPLYISPIIADPITTPVATLTIFHDGQYSGQHKYASRVLKGYELRASLAIIPAWINDYPTVGAGAYPATMTEAQIIKMYDVGHELIHHTGTCGPSGHVNVGWDDTSKYPDGQEYALVKADIMASQDWMRARGLTRGLGYGVVGFTNGLVKTQTLTRRTNITRALRDAGMKKIRQAGTYYESYYGACQEPAMLLPQNPLVQDATASGTVTGWVDQMIARGGWSGLTFHNIYLGSTTGANDVSVAKYETIIAYIAAKVAAGQLNVLPMSEAMAEMDAVPLPV